MSPRGEKEGIQAWHPRNVTLHPATEVTMDREDAATHWEALEVVPRLQSLLPNPIYRQLLISSVKPSSLSKTLEELQYKGEYLSGRIQNRHGFFG